MNTIPPHYQRSHHNVRPTHRMTPLLTRRPAPGTGKTSHVYTGSDVHPRRLTPYISPPPATTAEHNSTTQPSPLCLQSP